MVNNQLIVCLGGVPLPHGDHTLKHTAAKINLFLFCVQQYEGQAWGR